MSDSNMAAVIGACGALAGVCLTLLFQARQKAAENKRWYAEFFMKDQLDTLRSLYAYLVDLYEVVRLYANPNVNAGSAEYAEACAKYKVLAHQEALAYPYLEGKEVGMLMTASMLLMAFVLRETPNATPTPGMQDFVTKLQPLTWDAIVASYEQARTALEPYISPDVMRQITSHRRGRR